jgi:hypothetical protein
MQETKDMIEKGGLESAEGLIVAAGLRAKNKNIMKTPDPNKTTGQNEEANMDSGCSDTTLVNISCVS